MPPTSKQKSEMGSHVFPMGTTTYDNMFSSSFMVLLCLVAFGIWFEAVEERNNPRCRFWTSSLNHEEQFAETNTLSPRGILLTHLIQKHLGSEPEGGKANTAAPKHASTMPIGYPLITLPETLAFHWPMIFLLQPPAISISRGFPVHFELPHGSPMSQVPGIAVAGACLRGVIWAKSDLTIPPCPAKGHPLGKLTALPT